MGGVGAGSARADSLKESPATRKLFGFERSSWWSFGSGGSI